MPNSFADISPKCKMVSGRYTGNATDARAIDVGVDLTAYSIFYILLKGHGQSHTNYYQYDNQSENGRLLSSVTSSVNYIQSINSNGFVIGAAAIVNANGELFDYVVYYQE